MRFHHSGKSENNGHESLVIRPQVLEVLEQRRLLAAPNEHSALLRQDVVLAWNDIMLDANAADHSLAAPDQGGPTKTSRAFAMVSTAVFDAVNAIGGKYQPYLIQPAGYRLADMRAAVAVAAHDTLLELYPQQANVFDDALDRWLGAIPNGFREQKGIQLGHLSADACIASRVDDGSDVMVMHMPTNEPGHHQPDPDHPGQGFLGPVWGEVTPFVIEDVAGFRSPAPPAMTSAEYTEAFDEVKAYGGNGTTTSTIRTEEQTNIGLYWAYDGTPGLGTPPRLYNQITVQIARQKHNSVEENARLLALVNLSMADAGIQCWDNKYFHDFWRPVIGIRQADTDGNADTLADPNWTPLGAPYSNGDGSHQNFTPPFPAYGSGHATFGAATFETIANFYRTNRIRFTFVSDELNGVTTDNNGVVRDRVPRTFRNLDQAIQENAQSRIYLGIHWSFDASEGIRSGKAIADYVTENVLRPRHGGPHHALLSGATAPQLQDSGATMDPLRIEEVFSQIEVI